MFLSELVAAVGSTAIDPLLSVDINTLTFLWREWGIHIEAQRSSYE